jgi:hypothetical protein
MIPATESNRAKYGKYELGMACPPWAKMVGGHYMKKALVFLRAAIKRIDSLALPLDHVM